MNQTTGHVYQPAAPEGCDIYFYVGWDAHKEGIPLSDNATNLEWRAGWICRQDMIMHAIMTGRH